MVAATPAAPTTCPIDGHPAAAFIEWQGQRHPQCVMHGYLVLMEGGKLVEVIDGPATQKMVAALRTDGFVVEGWEDLH